MYTYTSASDTHPPFIGVSQWALNSFYHSDSIREADEENKALSCSSAVLKTNIQGFNSIIVSPQLVNIGQCANSDLCNGVNFQLDIIKKQVFPITGE